MEVSHDRTIVLNDGDVLRDHKIVNKDPRQATVKCHPGAEDWRIDNVVSEGGAGVVLRGGHGIAHDVRSFGSSQSGIYVYETDAVPERITNDITVADCVVEDCGLSGIHVQGPVFGVTIKDTIVRRAGQDGITGYDHGGDMVRVVRCDVVGAANHGIHVGGHQVYIVGCTVKGVTGDGGFCLFLANHTNRPPIDLAVIDPTTFLNAEDATGALWARGIRRLRRMRWSHRMARTVERIESDVADHFHLGAA